MPSGSSKIRYLRNLADLPWQGVAVRLRLRTRKFRCRNDLCSRKVFCERLLEVIAPFARRTVRLTKIVELLAFALGTRASAKAATKLSFLVGKDVCLQAMRRALSPTETKSNSCETAPHHESGAGKPPAVLPFAAYLEKRWRMGEHNGLRLWQEIKERGFRGEVDSVQRFIRPWRAAAVGKTPHPVAIRGLAPRRIAKLLLNPERQVDFKRKPYS